MLVLTGARALRTQRDGRRALRPHRGEGQLHGEGRVDAHSAGARGHQLHALDGRRAPRPQARERAHALDYSIILVHFPTHTAPTHPIARISTRSHADF